MEPASNRAALLRVALDLFASRGYDATGVKEIVESVGVSKPTLYHYFGAKSGLLDALIDEYGGDFAREFAAAAVYEHDLPATLQRIVTLYLRFATQQPTFYRFLLSLLFVPADHEAHAVAARVFGEQRRVLEELFAAAARDHGNMRGRQTRYAHALLGVLTSHAALALNGQIAVDAASCHQIVQQFSHGIYS